nr:hypothetical protein [Tanacetum cinerariifolium]
TFRVILLSIHSDKWKSFQSHHQTALRDGNDKVIRENKYDSGGDVWCVKIIEDVSMNGLEILRVNNLVNGWAELWDGCGGLVCYDVCSVCGLGTMDVKWQKWPQPNLIGLLTKDILEKLVKVVEAGGVLD